jgi:hypothetical protein
MENVPIIPNIYDLHKQLLRTHFHEIQMRPGEPEPFARGANNLLYRFHLDNMPVLAKIGINAKFRFLNHEFSALSHIGSIGPKVIDFFTDKESGTQILILELIEGFHPVHFSNDQICSFVNTIATYHELSNRLPDIKHYTSATFLENCLCPANATGITQDIFARYQRILQSATHYASLENATRCRSLVHGDLIPNNIILDKNGVFRIIDWEGVRYDSPESDLATFVKAFNFTQKQIEDMLTSYSAPFNRKVFNFRLLTHYLQVISWRLGVQLQHISENEFEAALSTLENELSTAEEMEPRL